MKYNLSENNDESSNGCIVASLHRHGDSWACKAKGYYTQEELRLPSGVAKIC